MDFGVLDCFLVYYYHPQKQYAVCVLLFFMCMGGVGYEKDASGEASCVWVLLYCFDLYYIKVDSFR